MMNPVFSPFPLLNTDHLELRAVDTHDAGEIFLLRSDERVLRYIDRAPATSLAETMTFIEQVRQNILANENILWGIAVSNRDVVIGTITFWHIEKEHHRAEIGYVLHPAYHRQGIMSEAMQAVLGYGFGVMGLHSVTANINPANAASKGLLEKHGFQREAYFRESYYFEGKFLDSEIYTLLAGQSRIS